MKVKVNVTVAPWCSPEKVNFDEGMKLPIYAVDPTIIQHLCRKWLDEVCEKSGMTYQISFEAKGDTQ